MDEASLSTGTTAEGQEPDSALLVAARQLSEEAWLRPQLAGLTGIRRRDAASRSRRAARRTTVLPAA